MLLRFVEWSAWHYVFIASPFVAILLLYFGLRKTSDTIRYWVGVVIGVLSLGVLLMRNIDIYVHGGFDPEIIPLQVCHFGNIMVFVALVFRSKIATAIAWTLNMVCAFCSFIFADSLASYDDVMCITAQAYIWGHILIVVGSAYAVLLKIVRIDYKSYLWGIFVLILIAIPAAILNPYFYHFGPCRVNYFYFFDSDGVPFEFLYHDQFTLKIGEWFQINYVYTLSVIALGLVVMTGFFFLQKLLYIKDKNYKTHNIFYKEKKTPEVINA